MTESDLARLQLAKRAYQAAQPSEREVQTGVRRARLSLERRKPRRNWFSKGAVMVVLAVGGLAYAKPQAARDMLARVTNVTATDHGRALVTGRGRGSEPLPSEANQPQHVSPNAETSAPAPATSVPTAVAAPAPVEASSVEASAVEASGGALATSPLGASETRVAARSEKKTAAVAELRQTVTNEAAAVPTGEVVMADPGSSTAKPITEWGRVGDALAQGDERRALSALSELADSDDPRTRDKADLGRAQLLMAHGSSDKACAIARSLTNRRAGSRIERQAQVLLKSCR